MYATLGNRCVSITNALTSNKKFITPDNEVYQQYYTYMYKYPGQDITNVDNKLLNNRPPEHVKAYDVEEETPEFKHEQTIQPVGKQHNCSSCSSK